MKQIEEKEMTDSPSSAVPFMGRILMSSVFLVFGVLKFTTFPYYVQLAAGKGMPLPQAAIMPPRRLWKSWADWQF